MTRFYSYFACFFVCIIFLSGCDTLTSVVDNSTPPAQSPRTSPFSDSDYFEDSPAFPAASPYTSPYMSPSPVPEGRDEDVYSLERLGKSYVPLVKAMCESQVIHYDSFDGQPDSFTINYFLYYSVICQQAFPYRIIQFFNFKDEDGSYTFYYPETFYEEYFAEGTYQNPPSALESITEEYENSLIIKQAAKNYHAKVYVADCKETGDYVNLRLSILKYSHVDNTEKHIGEAKMTLVKDVWTAYGYKIVSFVPEYAGLD